MPDFNRVEHQLSEFLQLDQRPVAIAFRDVPPPAVAKFTGTEPSGCSFWRLAGRGRVFYTIPSDHYNCRSDRTRTIFHCRPTVPTSWTTSSGS